eukprot:CAMPEP_0176121766 /NCGR_PEP_ID=MMETSP0120_2-20121206/61303_1 /TAXON_ID=160619 /ORGANISM="Kryptoperidinium foliaceum, Strain CCMP 1326" /LENGTH=31 /DNA_ID= /DNA_START= /DNA_END= /DNA_ORIENTATION=
MSAPRRLRGRLPLHPGAKSTEAMMRPGASRV